MISTIYLPTSITRWQEKECEAFGISWFSSIFTHDLKWFQISIWSGLIGESSPKQENLENHHKSLLRWWPMEAVSDCGRDAESFSIFVPVSHDSRVCQIFLKVFSFQTCFYINSYYSCFCSFSWSSRDSLHLHCSWEQTCLQNIPSCGHGYLKTLLLLLCRFPFQRQLFLATSFTQDQSNQQTSPSPHSESNCKHIHPKHKQWKAGHLDTGQGWFRVTWSSSASAEPLGWEVKMVSGFWGRKSSSLLSCLSYKTWPRTSPGQTWVQRSCRQPGHRLEKLRRRRTSPKEFFLLLVGALTFCEEPVFIVTT